MALTSDGAVTINPDCLYLPSSQISKENTEVTPHSSSNLSSNGSHTSGKVREGWVLIEASIPV